MNNSNPTRIGRYEVLRPIGVGSLGRVYLARDASGDQTVALKVFDPSSRGAVPRETAERLFMSEAQAAAQLRHAHIATVHEVGMEGDMPFVAMECVFNGRSLARHCESSAERLPIEDAIRIARSCANALQHAHERGVVHRDIKPRNILLDVGLEPKLVDFGFSVVSQLLRGGNSGLGGRYLAPEQLADRAVGTQADIYSLGVVLYELLAGRHPFEGSSAERGMQARHTPVRKYRSDAPRVLEMITDRCLAREPGDRYSTALHLAANLEVAADQLALSSSGAAKREVFKRVRRLPLFAPFSERELKEMVVDSTVRTFRAGDEVIANGDTAACFYVVISGEVGVRRDAMEFVHLGPGEYFGEVGALTGLPRTSPVVALDRCVLLSVPATFLDEGPPACQLHLKTTLVRDLAMRVAQGGNGIC